MIILIPILTQKSQSDGIKIEVRRCISLMTSQMSSKSGFIILCTSPQSNLVKLMLTKELTEKIKNRCTSFYGKDVHFYSFWTRDRKRMKNKFKCEFRNMIESHTLYHKFYLQNYINFLNSIQVNNLAEGMELCSL